MQHIVNKDNLNLEFGDTPKKSLSSPNEKNRVLMHCCCAPCSSAMIEACLSFDITPVILFFNPNIHPEKEYLKRKSELIEFARHLSLEFVDCDYTPESWFDDTKGLENEPERGKRCEVCFTHRLMFTASYAAEHDIPHFTTTLMSSRWKDINQIKRAASVAEDGVENKALFWDQDWRKEGLSNRKDYLIKRLDFYNQNYCGCVYSLRDTRIRMKEKALNN